MSRKIIHEEKKVIFLKKEKFIFFKDGVDICNVQVICRHMCHITPPLPSPPLATKKPLLLLFLP